MHAILRSLALALLLPAAVALAADEAGFRPLFNGKDLTGWKLRNPAGHASWSVQDGLLVNDAGQQHGTDLVTTETFKDFTLRYEYRIPKGANSGMYLRGRHEIVLGCLLVLQKIHLREPTQVAEVPVARKLSDGLG